MKSSAAAFLTGGNNLSSHNFNNDFPLNQRKGQSYAFVNNDEDLKHSLSDAKNGNNDGKVGAPAHKHAQSHHFIPRPVTVKQLLSAFNANGKVLSSDPANKGGCVFHGGDNAALVGESTLLLQGYPTSTVHLVGRILAITGPSATRQLFPSQASRNRGNSRRESVGGVSLERPFSLLTLSDHTGSVGVVFYHTCHSAGNPSATLPFGENYTTDNTLMIPEDELDFRVGDTVSVVGRLAFAGFDGDVTRFFPSVVVDKGVFTDTNSSLPRADSVSSLTDVVPCNPGEGESLDRGKTFVLLPGAEEAVPVETLNELMGLQSDEKSDSATGSYPEGTTFMSETKAKYFNTNGSLNDSKVKKEKSSQKHHVDKEASVIVPFCVKGRVSLVLSSNEVLYHYLDTVLTYLRFRENEKQMINSP